MFMLNNFFKTSSSFYLLLVGLFPLGLIIGTLIPEILILIIIFGFFYEMLVNKDFTPLKSKIFIFLCIVWIYLIFNYFTISVDKELSSSRSFFFIRFPLLMISINYFINKSDYKLDLIFKLWAITLVVTIFDLFFQYFFGFNTLGFDITWAHGKLSGFMGHELKMAHLLIGFVMPTLSYYFMKNKNFLIMFIFLLIFFVILFLINERSNAIKGTFIIFFILFFYNGLNIKKKLLSFFIFISIIISIISFNHEVNQRFYNELKSMSKNLKSELTFHGRVKESITDASLMEHIKYSNYGPHYYAAYDIFKNNKLFGIGLKTFRTQCEYAKVPEDISSRKCAIHPHQIYLEMLAEIGLFGFILFFIFFTVIILKSLKTYFKENDLILLSLCAFICSQILPVLPSGSFFTSFSAIIFWTNISLIYSLLIKYKKI